MVAQYARALSGELAVEEFQRTWGYSGVKTSIEMSTNNYSHAIPSLSRSLFLFAL